jgi:hypothetical protein
MTSTRRSRVAALAVAAFSVAAVRLVAPQQTAAPPELIRLAQIYADPVGEGDGQIGGPMMYGYPVGNNPIGGPMVYGAPAGEGDGQIGGPMMYGGPVGNGPIGGSMVGGAPVDSGGEDQPIGGDTLY